MRLLLIQTYKNAYMSAHKQLSQHGKPNLEYYKKLNDTLNKNSHMSNKKILIHINKLVSMCKFPEYNYLRK